MSYAYCTNVGAMLYWRGQATQYSDHAGRAVVARVDIGARAGNRE